MSEEDKQVYRLKAEKDTIRYKCQLDELETKGYFTHEDGTKSTDIATAIPNGSSNLNVAKCISPRKQTSRSPKTVSLSQKSGKQVEASNLQAIDANSNLTTQSSLSTKGMSQKSQKSKKGKLDVSDEKEFQKPGATQGELDAELNARIQNSQKKQKRD